MLLKHFTKPQYCVDFDPAEGTGGDLRRVGDADTVGFCEDTEFGWVAIYPDPEGETLLVQVDGTTWDVFAPETRVGYNHHYDEATTTFAIEDDANAFEATYDAWWKDVEWFDPNRWACSQEPENAEEDVFGYVRYLRHHRDRREDFVDPWAAKMGGR